MKEDLVFKTNLGNSMNISEVKPIIENIKGIVSWNVDLHDVDSILRIEAEDLKGKTVEKEIKRVGYYCEELT